MKEGILRSDMKTNTQSYATQLVILYEFKIRYTLEQRIAETEEVKIRVSDKVPVIVEEVSENSWLPPLARRKLLMPRQMTAGQFIHLLRARLNISANVPLLVFIGEKIVQATDLIGHIYDKFHDEDGFLYVAYTPDEHLSGPKKYFRVQASPPPPPTTPNSSIIEQSGSSKLPRKTRKTRATKYMKSASAKDTARKMRKAGSKHSDDRSHKSVSREGSVKRHASKRETFNVDDADGRRKKSEMRKAGSRLSGDRSHKSVSREGSMKRHPSIIGTLNVDDADGRRKKSEMRKARSKLSDDRSRKSVSREGSMKRHTSKRGTLNVDDADGRRKRSEMRKAGSKLSDDRSRKSVSPEGSLKRHASKRETLNVDEADGRRKKSEDRKDRENRKNAEHLGVGSISSRNSPDDFDMKPKASPTQRSSSVRQKRASSLKPRTSPRGTKTSEDTER